MTTHALKTHPEHFAAIISGDKTFEVRYNDRAFAVGDILCLLEWQPLPGGFTGRAAVRRVTHLLDSEQFEGVKDGWCILSIKEVGEEKK